MKKPLLYFMAGPKKVPPPPCCFTDTLLIVLGKRYRLADVLDAADPGSDALHAHAKSRVGDRAVLAQFQIPLERFLGQTLLVDAR